MDQEIKEMKQEMEVHDCKTWLTSLVAYIPTKDSINSKAETVRSSELAKKIGTFLSHRITNSVSILLTIVSLFLRDAVYFWFPKSADVTISLYHIKVFTVFKTVCLDCNIHQFFEDVQAI